MLCSLLKNFIATSRAKSAEKHSLLIRQTEVILETLRHHNLGDIVDKYEYSCGMMWCHDEDIVYYLDLMLDELNLHSKIANLPTKIIDDLTKLLEDYPSTDAYQRLKSRKKQIERLEQLV